MSGGSWNYMHIDINDAGETLQRSSDPLRARFGAHLRLVAKAMHDIEWVDSGDYGSGREHDAILAALNDAAPVDSEARRQIKELGEALIALSEVQP